MAPDTWRPCRPLCPTCRSEIDEILDAGDRLVLGFHPLRIPPAQVAQPAADAEVEHCVDDQGPIRSIFEGEREALGSEEVLRCGGDVPWTVVESVTAQYIYRATDGKIVETWQRANTAGLVHPLDGG